MNEIGMAGCHAIRLYGGLERFRADQARRDPRFDDEWQLTFAVNIHAMLYLTKAAVAQMPPGSAIINTASVNSAMPNPPPLAYATTKGTIQNFTGDWHRCWLRKAFGRMPSLRARSERR